MDILTLFNDCQNGNIRALSKAMTLLESNKVSHQKDILDLLDMILDELSLKESKSTGFVIAITGVPGVGKSTLIEKLGLFLIEQGKRVAVLAIDPSSPISGGSLLGDKTRMEFLSRSEQAFIRPSCSAGNLGGVSKKTHGLVYLCLACHFDYILVETVGVGQSEYEAKNMSDYFLYMTLPNAGDFLQGIKKGILELADDVIINKYDHSDSNKMMAEKTKEEISDSFSLSNRKGSKILLMSALENIGIDKLGRDILLKHCSVKKRREQLCCFKESIVKDALYKTFINHQYIKKLLTNKSVNESLVELLSSLDNLAVER